MHPTKIKKKIGKLIDKLLRKGAGGGPLGQTMMHNGLDLFRDANGVSGDAVIVRDNGAVEWATRGYKAAIVPEEAPDMLDLLNAVRQSGNQFLVYEASHRAKGTPDADLKADVNRDMAALCFRALREEMPDSPEISPVQADSPVSGAPVPLQVAGYDAVLAMRARLTESAEWMQVPDDKHGFFLEGLDQHLTVLERYFASGATTDLSVWISRKANQARATGHSDIAAVLEALVAEIGHGLQDQPINLEQALREFYADCHARNVKAGWWTDLSNGSPKKRSVGELFILFVTELWEAYEAYITDANDDKLTDYPGIGVELGDLQIRLADFCGALAAGRIVEHSGVRNPGDEMFEQIGEIASRYEAIRKTPQAIGDPETGDPIPLMDVAVMVTEKLAFNATRADHKPENRMKEGGKQT